MDKVREKKLIRKDCVYFCFMRPENDERRQTHSIDDEQFSLVRLFKLKFSEGSIKVEYHGPVDASVSGFVHSFLRDYQSFIADKFAHKCTKRFLLNLRRRGQSISDIRVEPARMVQKFSNNVRRFGRSASGIISQLSESNDENNFTTKDTLPEVSNINVLDVGSRLRPGSKLMESENGELKEEMLSKMDTSTGPAKTREGFDEKCTKLIREIGEPGMDFSFKKIKNKKIELQIYFAFLKKYAQYKTYFDEASEWTQLPKFLPTEVFYRHDSSFMVRKATFLASVDPKMLGVILEDSKLIPKWNRMIGKHVLISRTN